MPKFIAEQDFWDVFPGATIGVLVCRGLKNTDQGKDYAPLLAEASAVAAAKLTQPEFSQNEVIQTWRKAYQQFKTKKGARSSIEALLKRAQAAAGEGGGRPISSINPLVDLYNSVSLRYAVPCGGEDLDTIQGDIHLTGAQGNEPFITLGSESSEPPLPGELIYKDGAGAICRCLNWRESVRTMLRPETRNAFMCIENVDPARHATMIQALHELQTLITNHLGGSADLHLLDQNHREIEW